MASRAGFGPRVVVWRPLVNSVGHTRMHRVLKTVYFRKSNDSIVLAPKTFKITLRPNAFKRFAVLNPERFFTSYRRARSLRLVR